MTTDCHSVRWIEKSPMRDGSGVIEVNSERYKIVVQDLISTKQRVAFQDGIEIARASKFTTLIKRLKARGRSQERGCHECNEDGLRDSGGVYPWGEPVLVPCDCKRKSSDLSELF